MLDPNEVAELRAFLDEMAGSDSQSQSAMAQECDQCINHCDLFASHETPSHGWLVSCLMNSTPTTCGGPYQRISKAG